MTKRIVYIAVFAAFFVVAIGLLRHGVTAKTSGLRDLPEWSAAVALSSATLGAEQPHIAAADDGSTVLVVYNEQVGNNPTNFDPFYQISNDNGETWLLAPQPIHESNANSIQVHATFDAAGTAHAVWVEDDIKLEYAAQTEWGGSSTTVTTAATSSGTAFMDNPVVVASGNNTLDLIAIRKDGGDSGSVYHARSEDGGASWPSNLQGFVADTFPFSFAPDAAVDQSGVIHVVWHENTIEGNSIYYSQGTPGAWTAPAKISGTVADANEPRILIDRNTLRVTFTNILSINTQFVYLAQCSANCTNEANWSSSTNVSGDKLGVNAQAPWSVLSTMVKHQGCVTAYYHGTTDAFAQDNELVWGSHSCDGWSERQRVTAPEVQSVFPNVASQDRWIYLVYESGSVGGAHQIYFVRSQSDVGVYLPLILNGS